MTYAGFGKRVAAYLVDAILYGVGSALVGQVVLFVLAHGMKGLSGAETLSGTEALVLMGVSFLISLACYVLYYVWPESTAWQATIGKKIFGLKVTDLEGNRISFWRSLGRNLGMILSSLILCIGYLMCLSTDKKQCLHDMLASCLVVDTAPDKKQICAIGTIVGCLVLLFALCVGLALSVIIPQYNWALENSRAASSGRMLGN